MVSAVRVGNQRVVELIGRYGLAVYQGAVADIQDHAERISRAAIARIPDGFYEAEFFLDGDGDDDKPLGQKLRVHVAITIAGEEITVDLSGSSDQSPGPLNSPRPTSISYVRYGVKSITMPGLPTNEGCFRPLKVILRPDSIFDPRPPAPTTLWVEASQNIPDLMLKALAPAMPDRVRASTFGSDVATFVYGTNPQSKRPYLLVEEYVPAAGARPRQRRQIGASCAGRGRHLQHPDGDHRGRLSPPGREYALVRDSGGPGRHRGGLGVIKTLTPVGHDCRLIATFERSKYSPAWGLFGGGDGGPNRLTLHRNDGSAEPHVKVTDMPVTRARRSATRPAAVAAMAMPSSASPSGCSRMSATNMCRSRPLGATTASPSSRGQMGCKSTRWRRGGCAPCGRQRSEDDGEMKIKGSGPGTGRDEAS